MRRLLERFGGREIQVIGDGFLATFDGPARAVRCAIAIRDGVRELGLEIRAGLTRRRDRGPPGRHRGIAVHIGARVSALAGAGRCSSRARSRTSSWAPASSSTTEGPTSSRASRASGGCSRFRPSAAQPPASISMESSTGWILSTASANPAFGAPMMIVRSGPSSCRT